MAAPIEDYALIGDTHTAGLVSNAGSLDWLCLPRFDSPACFAALLGDEDNGRWRIAPTAEDCEVSRSYRPKTMVLDTEFRTASGAVRMTDCMPVTTETGDHHDVIRLVEGLEGEVEMSSQLTLRFSYGGYVPWVRETEGGLSGVAGPDAVHLTTPAELRTREHETTCRFTLRAGERMPFVLVWHPSHQQPPETTDALDALEETERHWREWAECLSYEGDWEEAVHRSLLTLKALTYAPTGGVLAAATTSLPERIGGVRNWDYRCCWLRDATLTLNSLLGAGCRQEAIAWRDWLMRAAAGSPGDLQIMYGPAGERWLPEWELDWLAGYEGSTPVRVGNAASEQFQLDVYGEVMDSLYEARKAGMAPRQAAWELQKAMLDDLASRWEEPDEGIWEVRGGRRHFTHSKVMAWVAYDRAVRSVEEHRLEGPVERWRDLRDRIHQEVCERGFDRERSTFTQSFGSERLDASLLLLPLVGFLSPEDPRMCGTVDAIERELTEDGLLRRYPTPDESVDGLPPGEGAFLPCSFWLVDNLALRGRREEAVELFERLLDLRNDVGLFSEEYDAASGRMLGNFPQAFTHTSMVRSAIGLAQTEAGEVADASRFGREAPAGS